MILRYEYKGKKVWRHECQCGAVWFDKNYWIKYCPSCKFVYSETVYHKMRDALTESPERHPEGRDPNPIENKIWKNGVSSFLKSKKE